MNTSTPDLSKPCVPKAEAVPVERWGKDHWSTLAYIGTCGDGRLDNRKLRCNWHTHPLMLSTACRPADLTAPYPYGSYVKDGKIEGHDDWDCIDDFDAHGFVNIISLANCYVVLTEKGALAYQQLQRHKLAGKQYREFVWEERA